MAIIDVEDVTDYLSLSYASTAASTAAVEAIIGGLEADLQGYIRRPLVPTSFTETDPDIRVDRGTIKVRNQPVISIASFTIDGVAQVDGTNYVRERYGVSSIDFLSVPALGTLRPALSISYTAGLPGDDPASEFGAFVKAKLVQKAAAIVNKVVREDSAGTSSTSVEGTSLRWDTTETWSEQELKRFDRWKRRFVR